MKEWMLPVRRRRTLAPGHRALSIGQCCHLNTKKGPAEAGPTLEDLGNGSPSNDPFAQNRAFSVAITVRPAAGVA